MVHHPQRGFRDANGKLADFDAVELIDVHPRQLRRQSVQLPAIPRFRKHFLQDLDLEQPQLPVGDDQEVAAAARRVEEPHAAELLLKAEQRGAAAAVLARLQALEFRPQIVHEERLDHLQDVLLGRVVRAPPAALRRLQ